MRMSAPALPGNVARAAGAEERLCCGADALRGRQPRGGGRHAAALHGRLHAAASHSAAHAPRARTARPGASQDEGMSYTLILQYSHFTGGRWSLFYWYIYLFCIFTRLFVPIVGERTLYAAGVAMWSRPHGRATAIHEPDRRFYHIPPAQAGRRHRQRRSAGPSSGIWTSII